jgi:hypothetical protein
MAQSYNLFVSFLTSLKQQSPLSQTLLGMCTFRYLLLKNGEFILSSKSDESPIRKRFPSKKYLEKGVHITYLKDEVVVGACNDAGSKNRLVCLSNGGDEKHQRHTYNKMYRGVVVKNILTEEVPVH